MFSTKATKCILVAAVLFSALSISVSAGAVVVDKVIAVVNDEVVTQREFDRAMSPLRKSYEANFKGEELKKRMEAAQKGFLEQMINSKLAVSLAKQQDLQIDEEELQKRIQKIRDYYETEDAFLRDLNAKGTTLTEFERELRDQMLAQRLIDKEVSSKIIITPNEIKNLYEKNKDQLISPLSLKVRSIMVRKSKGSSGGEDRVKIDDIVSELQKGKDFAKLATECSEGPFAEESGDMGYLVRGQMLKELDDVLFTLVKGEISDVVESPVGYHIFKVEDIKQPHAMEFNEVNDFLRDQLYRKRFEVGLIEWLKEKREDAYISYK